MLKLTIKEVAKMAGVSPSAVSMAMNGRPGISKATRQRIMDIVGQTNFVPNQNSRSLVMKKTQAVALLFNTNTQPLDNLFHSQLSRYLLDYFSSKQYSLAFTSCEFKETQKSILPPFLRSGSVDGIIAYGYVPYTTISCIAELGLPFLLLDSHQSLKDSPAEICGLSLRVDYQKAARIAVRHLIEMGHTRIAYIGSNFPVEYSQQTFDGYQSVMQEHGLSVPMHWMQMKLKDSDPVDNSILLANMVLQSSDRPTAIFCASDVFSIGALQAVKALGLRVPDDISIIGIDNIVMTAYTDPALTTIGIDMTKLCTIGCDQLFKLINGEEINHTQWMYDEFALIKRNSVKHIS